MNLPSHILYTYASEKIFIPNYINENQDFVLFSLIFTSLPDLLESIPFIFYLYIKKHKYGLKNFRSIVNYASNITHNKPLEYEKEFHWASKISFYTHSFFVYIVVSIVLYIFFNNIFYPFLFGYGIHLLIDLFTHNDFFSIRPLYPVNNFSIPGFITWYKSKKFIIYNSIILFVLYLIIFCVNK